MNRRVLFGLLLSMIVYLTLSVAASAMEFTPPESMKYGEYKWVTNPNGTSTEYYQGTMDGAPWQGDTYMMDEMNEAARVFAEVGIDEGTTGQVPQIVSGGTPNTTYAADQVYDALKGKLFTTPGEAEVGDEIIAEGVAEGTLPTLAAVAAGLNGVIVGIGGPIVAGVALGVGVDELLGIPAMEELTGGSNIEVEAYNASYEAVWPHDEEVELGEVAACGVSALYSAMKAQSGFSTGEVCEFPSLQEAGFWVYEGALHECTGGIKCVQYEGGCTQDVGYNAFGFAGGTWWGYNKEGNCESVLLPDECPKGTVWFDCVIENKGSREVNLQFYSPLSEMFAYAAIPSKLSEESLKSKQKHVSGTGSTSAMPAIPEPVTPPVPADVPAPATDKIIHTAPRKPSPHEEKECEEEKCTKIKPVPLFPPVETSPPGTPEIPNPEDPTVPKPGVNELYTDYKAKVEAAGFPNVSENVLPDTSIDPEVGPNDVADVNPQPGTKAEPSTPVRVDVNPADAPNPRVPGEAGGGGIGPPTEPGLHFPKIGVLCTGFPFGVPCWLASTISSWSGTAVAPEWGFEGLKIEGHTITSAKFKLSRLEPIMEYVRPAMVGFATIGLVLLFFSFARGGGPPSGSGGDSGGSDQSYSEEQGNFIAGG
jgi:hypothetical protein